MYREIKKSENTRNKSLYKWIILEINSFDFDISNLTHCEQLHEDVTKIKIPIENFRGQENSPFEHQ